MPEASATRNNLILLNVVLARLFSVADVARSQRCLKVARLKPKFQLVSNSNLQIIDCVFILMTIVLVATV